MEGRINQKIETYIQGFKNAIIDVTKNENLSKESLENIVSVIYDYDKFKLTKDDLVKRKRVKNTIPLHDRCHAKRASGEQCTRRKKDECDYCGTHEKGRPHGIVDDNHETDDNNHVVKCEIWTHEIKGITYYIDNHNNVYNTEDVISNKVNPKVIAKYGKVGDVYSIPEFNI